MSEGTVHPLRVWRLREGYTLDAAAAGVDTVRSTWHDWETGRRLPGDRDTYERLYRFTKGEISANTMIFPFGYPPIGQMALPFAAGPAPLFDDADAAVSNRDHEPAGSEDREARGPAAQIGISQSLPLLDAAEIADEGGVDERPLQAAA